MQFAQLLLTALCFLDRHFFASHRNQIEQTNHYALLSPALLESLESNIRLASSSRAESSGSTVPVGFRVRAALRADQTEVQKNMLGIYPVGCEKDHSYLLIFEST